MDVQPATEKPRIQVAVGIVRKAGRYLIARRPEGVPLPGLWEFPGGKLHPNETPETAAVRELKEELGIDVTPIQRLPPIDHDYPHAHVTLTPILCHHTAGDPRPIHCTAFAWVTPDDLAHCTFPAANSPLLAQLARLPLQAAVEADRVDAP